MCRDLLPESVQRAVSEANERIARHRQHEPVFTAPAGPVESTVREVLGPILEYMREEEWGHPLGGGAGLVPEDLLGELARALRLTALRAGGVSRLAILNTAIHRANSAASFVHSMLFDLDPADLIEFEQTPEGWVVHEDRGLFLEVTRAIEEAYVSIWCEALEGALSAVGETPLRFLLRLTLLRYRQSRAASALARFKTPDAGGRPPNEHEATASIRRTGPPARAWVNLPQVLPAAA